MSRLTRRRFLAAGAAAATAGAIQRFTLSGIAHAGQLFEPEKGATLRVLRWKRFVQGDEEQFMLNTRRFTQLTGVEVRVDSENFEDLRPKAAVAANVGAGPDIIISTDEQPHLYPDKLLDVTDLAEYLGQKYGGWFDACREYGMHEGRWIAILTGASGGAFVYRRSMLHAAGHAEFPKELNGFLKLCQALKRNGTPSGLALAHATGDANGWTHWLLWAFGARLTDEDNRLALNSQETITALEYARELYQTFAPGTLSWLDPSNNKAFLAGEISLTLNGISIYYAAKKSEDPKLRAVAEDIYHAPLPVGPAGRSTELNLFSPGFIFRFTKYPNAAREYVRFMMEKDQYEAWQAASIGYVSQPLRAYRSNPIWTADPKHTPFRDIPERTLDNGYAGALGAASAGVMADYVMVNMVAEAASGQSSAQTAAHRAERRAKRYYS